MTLMDLRENPDTQPWHAHPAAASRSHGRENRCPCGMSPDPENRGSAAPIGDHLADNCRSRTVLRSLRPGTRAEIETRTALALDQESQSQREVASWVRQRLSSPKAPITAITRSPDQPDRNTSLSRILPYRTRGWPSTQLHLVLRFLLRHQPRAISIPC